MDSQDIVIDPTDKIRKRFIFSMVVNVLLVFLFVGLALFTFFSNQKYSEKMNELTSRNQDLEYKNANFINAEVTPTAILTSTPSPTVTPTRIIRPTEIITSWKDFVDKDVYGVSFQIPAEWTVTASEGTPSNTVGDRLVAMRKGNVVFQFIQIADSSGEDKCIELYCELKDVKVLDKVITLDLTSATTNDQKIPVNPRKSSTGINGFIQVEFNPEEITNEQDLSLLKKIFESMKYN
jgi:hypothetical protein